MAKYIINNKEVTEEEFNKQVFKAVEGVNRILSPFFLDEIVSVPFSQKSDAETEQILNEIRKIAGKKNKTEETLEDILKRNMSIGAPNWNESNTGGTVFEKVQDSSVPPYVDRMENISKEYYRTLENIYCGNFNRDTLDGNIKIGIKNNDNKLPIDRMITVQFPRAIEAIAKATLFGHNKYKSQDSDFLNYQRVEGGSQTYADAGARHGLNKNEIDSDSGLPHIFHKCWNAMAELELWIKENE